MASGCKVDKMIEPDGGTAAPSRTDEADGDSDESPDVG